MVLHLRGVQRPEPDRQTGAAAEGGSEGMGREENESLRRRKMRGTRKNVNGGDDGFGFRVGDCGGVVVLMVSVAWRFMAVMVVKDRNKRRKMRIKVFRRK